MPISMRAVAGALYGIYYNAGQSCEARSRILVQDGDLRSVRTAASSKSAQRLRVGNPEDPATHVGAITSREQYDKIKAYCEIGVAEGAKLLLGGERPAISTRHSRRACFGARRHSKRSTRTAIAREEIFGPVATFVRFEDEAEAIALANDSEFGLVGERMVAQHRPRESRGARDSQRYRRDQHAVRGLSRRPVRRLQAIRIRSRTRHGDDAAL